MAGAKNHDFHILPPDIVPLATTIGALTVAKAILLVNALPVGRRYDSRPLARSILWKTLLFGALTLLFHYLEEVLPHVRALGGFAAAHRHAMAETSPARHSSSPSNTTARRTGCGRTKRGSTR